MKNPFLEDRNIFSKVQKPTTKISIDDKVAQTHAIQKMPSYESKYAVKPQNKPINAITSNAHAHSANQIYSAYQKEPVTFSSTEPNIAAKKYSAEKITFGDPTSAEGYNGQRTSGYFNIGNIQQHNPAKLQNKYDNLKYEPKKNNYFELQNKQTSKESYQGYDTKEKKKSFGNHTNYGNYGNQQDEIKIDCEFSPPPINNFTTHDIQKKYQYQKEYKKTYDNEQRSNYQASSNRLYQPQDESLPNQLKFDNKKNPFKSNQYKSPPKQYDQLLTTKNDISQRFKDNNYTELSPIGEVSRHKINQDSMMNLDGIMEGIQLDKLLAESKTQEQLLKILGMDASVVKKSSNQYNKNHAQFDDKLSKYGNKHMQPNPYTSNFTQSSQQQNQFVKRAYKPDTSSQQNRFQTFNDENGEPQVFNYGEPSVKKITQSIKPQKTQFQKHNQSPPKFTGKKDSQTQEKPSKNQYHYSQIPNQQPLIYQNLNPSINKQENYDLQKIMEKEMQKFMLQRQGCSKDRRVFLTANQKIVTKKYKLKPL